MSESEPFEGAPDLNRPVAGRHRAPTSAAQRILYRVVAPLCAVAVVVAVILVIIGIGGHSAGSGPGAGVISPPTTTPIITPTVTASPSITPSQSAAPPPTSPATHPPRPPAWRTAMADVRVYNSTRITGLAHHVAAEIAARGWTVPEVGNVVGDLPYPTLYYSPGARDAAVHLQHEFSGIRRIAPNGTKAIDFRGLTLVLTANWHD